jgi:hypothetical protein
MQILVVWLPDRLEAKVVDNEQGHLREGLELLGVCLGGPGCVQLGQSSYDNPKLTTCDNAKLITP